jgi:hypothetical protein
VNFLTCQSNVGERRDVGGSDVPLKLSSVPLDITTRLRGVIFVSQPALCLRFDIERVGLPDLCLGLLLAECVARGGARPKLDQRGEDQMSSLSRNDAYRPYGTDRIATLVANLSRSIALLDADIESEEKRTQFHDVSDPCYPMLALNLRARRDNLQATINLLTPIVRNLPLAA